MKAKIIAHEFASISFECSNCHQMIQESYKFCPNCGAEFTHTEESKLNLNWMKSISRI